MVIGIALVVAGFLLTALLPILFWIGIPMALIGAAMVFLYLTKNTASLATAASEARFEPRRRRAALTASPHRRGRDRLRPLRISVRFR